MPVVVADRVLDVPHFRQEKSQWCWAACAQMLVEYYGAKAPVIQADLAEDGQGNKTDNEPKSFNVIKTIIDKNTNKTAIEKEGEFTETQLRSMLNNGNPVIYLIRRYNTSSKKWTGHYRVIYGYYKTSSDKYVYLVHDPWDQANAGFGSNAHLDIWRRSWTNLLRPDLTDLDIDRNPGYGYTDYYFSSYMYCE